MDPVAEYKSLITKKKELETKQVSLEATYKEKVAAEDRFKATLQSGYGFSTREQLVALRDQKLAEVQSTVAAIKGKIPDLSAI